ncbi:universal stress protein [Saccharopolyspora shandongensis]|uniref:Nucleotide-binding universal stress protein, UspA family n=1 Tax=Saccharopolyspora shandongensis TaxID=418495 RepID=A0A1H2STS5_9PSEU|nr:universal stress protein [Saccharopolyspora shandongensis]SDW34424.1 Nucleotide-binding universal stress protein, UspA family [Saccharopolyspora shandongensis]
MPDQTIQQVEIDGGVVVGVDSSASSLRALIVAAAEARRRSVPLHVVRAWSFRTAPRPADCPPNVVPSMDEFQQSVEADTERIVANKLGEHPDLPIHIHVVHSPSPQALLSASRGADLLVVGHRGRGGFAGLMLGSVAEQCVRHAACPVLVVRPSV